jgi:2-oxoglutarate ferredoxin oxidoreductase subunit delta
LEMKNGKVSVSDGMKCISCSLCEMRCPDYAIYLQEMVVYE